MNSMGRETNDAREKRTRARREVVSLAVIAAFPVSDLVHKPFIFCVGIQENEFGSEN